MRLFNVHSLQLESFFGKELPRYAILSHRWGPDDEELTFHDVQAKNLDKPGIGRAKLRGCIARAKHDKIDYIWVDTFCINKADDATELTKAINSMFAWYQTAAICYVYLCDVKDAPPLPQPSRFETSQWFRRGWTLQELLAPRQVLFFNRKRRTLGSKRSLSAKVEKATGISAGFLEGVWRLEDASIAQRMSWAAGRITKEPEDVAYSLLGIFGVNMPLIYGEGANAFIRLQEEISKKFSDDSILAWGMSPSTPMVEEVGAASPGNSRDILASSPADFLGSGNIVFDRDAPPMHWSSGSGSLGIEMSLCTDKFGQMFGLLHCHAADDSDNVVGIPLERLSAQRSNEYVRPAGLNAKFLPLEVVRKYEQVSPAALIRIRVSPLADRNKDQDRSSRFWIKGLTSVGLEVAETSPDGCWNALNSTVAAPVDDTARRHIWLRLRKMSDNENTFDFILLLSNEPTTQGGPRPLRKTALAVCSRTARLPNKIYGGAPSLDFWQSDSSAPACMHLTLRQSEQFIGAKSTYVIDLGVADAQYPRYMDLTGDFSRIELQANIVDSLDEIHDKHIAALDSSIETLDSAIARLQGLRDSLGSQREGAKNARRYECRDPYDYDDFGSSPLDRYDQIVHETLQMMDDGGKGKAGQMEADALFELIIAHISKGVDLKRPAGWTPREVATYHAARHGQYGPLDFLKKLGADLEKALLCCAKEGHAVGVETLLQAGASPDGPKDCAKPPLILAVSANHHHLVDMLLDHDASLDVVDEEGLTPNEMASTPEWETTGCILYTHTRQREDEAGAQEKVEKALDQICWSLNVYPP